MQLFVVMFTKQVLAALAAVSAVAANFDALDNSNMAVYWVSGLERHPRA